MDHRWFFAIGDFFANIFIGLVVAVAAWAIVQPGWNMWLTMFGAMALGMFLGLVFFFPFSLKLGAMEVMVPLMFSGMLSGMVVGMAGTMVPLTLKDALTLGGLCGLAGILTVWCSNIILRGLTREAGDR